MEAYTLGRDFRRVSVVDVYNSFIWTERYYGDSEVEITAPATRGNIDLLSEGTLLELIGAKEPMMLETHDIDEGVLKVSGISLLKWMNNRFIRTSAAHEDRYWNLTDLTPGQVMATVVSEMLITAGPTGVPDPTQYLITGLTIKDQDASGNPITVAIPYGPVFDALYEIGTTYQVGMTLTLEHVDATSYQLGFSSYKGLDRTSAQLVRPTVRFSPEMESLTAIKELRSISNYKTAVHAFCPPNPDGLASVPGLARVSDSPLPTQFDLRAFMLFVEDVTTDQLGGSAATMTDILNQRAEKTLKDQAYVAQVDGEIVPTNQFRYGRDYYLGDIIEIAGYSGIIQNARITEYTRSQDASGETAYPGVTLII